MAPCFSRLSEAFRLERAAMDFELRPLPQIPEACAASYDDVQLLADAQHPNPKHVLGVQVRMLKGLQLGSYTFS